MAVEVGQLSPAADVGCFIQNTDHGRDKPAAGRMYSDFFGGLDRRHGQRRHQRSPCLPWTSCTAVPYTPRFFLGRVGDTADGVGGLQEAVGFEDIHCFIVRGPGQPGVDLGNRLPSRAAASKEPGEEILAGRVEVGIRTAGTGSEVGGPGVPLSLCR